MLNKVISYTITGGSSFKITTPGNPAIEHDGSQTVGHLYCSVGEVSAIAAYVSNFGCKFEFWGMQEQTSEQEKERHALLGMQREDAVFPTVKCPECAWFDPLIKSYCGLIEWPQESKQVLLTQSHHVQHQKDCPSPHYWQKDNFLEKEK